MNTTLEQYRTIVKFLGTVLNSNCEICLQDCFESHSIIEIANGNVSGRTIGSPLTDLALKMIHDEEWKNKDYECNYSGQTTDGRILCSSTFFIKENDILLGMLCINIDNSIYDNICESLQSLILHSIPSNISTETATTNNKPIEMFSDNRYDFLYNTINEINNKLNKSISIKRLNQKERIEIIKELNDRGVFLVKGTISIVSDILNCSEASTYRYLSQVNKNQ